MAGQWKWTVEAKEFELVVRGGNTGVRFFERTSKTNRSIFLQRAEVAWLDSVVEELVAVKISEVFWDQSRAGYPRIIAEKRSNRHGNFLTLEEFDGRKRCGSIMIPEGRYGQGWDRLKLEVSRVNSSLSVREKWKCKKVTVGRSYAEVVREAQADGSEVRILKSRHNKDPAMGTCPSGKGVVHEQMPAMTGEGSKGPVFSGVGLAPVRSTRDPGKSNACAEPIGRIPVSERRAPVISTPSIVPLSTSKTGPERLKGRVESEGDGQSGLCVRLELLAIKGLLTNLKGEVEGAMQRMDAALVSLELNGPNLGLSESQRLDYSGQQAMGLRSEHQAGPQSRNIKKKKKKKKKPKCGLNKRETVPLELPESRKFHEGETSATGTLSSAEATGRAAPSILGKYKWVGKAMGSAGKGVSVSASSTQNSGGGLAGDEVVPATQTTPMVEPALQTTPTVTPGCLGCSEVAGPTPVISFLMPNPYDNLMGMPAGDVFHGKFIQAMTGGGLLAEEHFSGLKDSSLVPWSPRFSDLDRDGSSDSGGEGSADYSLSDCCVAQNDGEGEFMAVQQLFSPGLHMVPYMEEEPTPLNWSQALGDGESGGPHVAGKEKELIMATSHILGVSCDGHFDKLWAAYALILGGRPKKVNKKPVRGSQEGKKGLRELANLQSGVNYEGGSESVSRGRNKGRGNRLMI
jgi:hypothetical protein